LLGERRAIKYVIVPREISRMTIDEWRSNPDSVAAARKVLNDPMVRMMLDVCINSSPANEGILVSDLALRAVHQAKTEGYHGFLNNLEAMAKPVQVSPILEPEFSNPDHREESQPD
jgi:hypothetical protein